MLPQKQPFPKSSRFFSNIRRIFCLAGAAILFTACSSAGKPAEIPTAAPGIIRTGQLTPYIPQAAPPSGGETSVSARPSTATPLPSPTATPRTHVVKKGEDMGGIAWAYRVSLEALMAANPTVHPNMMSVGTTLVIPPSKTQAPGTEKPAGTGANPPDANPPTPTPVPLKTGSLSCARVEDGGVWCFMAVSNPQSYPLEGLSAVFHLADQQGKTILSQLAFLPLDRLEPGARLPLSAYFPPDQVAALTPPYQTIGELLTALPSADDGRYMPTHLENKKVMLAENKLSANISADILLDYSGQANRVWVAAIAYDAGGAVIGVRRWEKKDARPIKQGQAFAMAMSVYSVSTEIDRIELFSEARP